MSFRSILVANRGEIAVRVIRTAKALGYRTVAVYSEPDRNAPHVRLADDAACLGPAPVSESYLNTERILEAARATGAEAVHPGYGFLSENADFARACEQAGLVFIGPTPEAIELMGNKAAAKRRMIAAGVPCVPGYEGEAQSDDVLAEAAARIGFPIMVKAAAGGGGRGMRLVGDGADLHGALRLARSEAQNAFGSGELILEKAIVRPRHVEVQVMADVHGSVVHLNERDCSVQRRHQKVVEEAPCPVMTAELRERMGAAAVEAARSIGYRGAGTVEFLLDESGHFYFLEMNTRLQVEHPVTEMITGLDLVAMQISVAHGEPLGLAQSDVELRGHAIEVRLYAEDPAQDFLPCTGPVYLWRPPAGDGIRVDAGIETGLEISPYYDPMVAKVIAWGETRESARRRLVEALDRTVLFGPRTNRDFLIAALDKPTFAAGRATTAFLADEFSGGSPGDDDPNFAQAAAAAVLQHLAGCELSRSRAVTVSAPLRDWSSSGSLTTRCRYQAGENDFDLTVRPVGADTYSVSGGDRSVTIEVGGQNAERTALTIDARRYDVASFAPDESRLFVSLGGKTSLLRNLLASSEAAEEAGGGGHVVAPMHGLLLDVFAEVGADVSRGDRLAVLEAMKMQHEITASVDGVVREVHCKKGEQVAADALLMELEVRAE